MTREETVQIVRELDSAANARDTARIMRLYAVDAVLVSPVWGRLIGRRRDCKNLGGHVRPVPRLDG